MYGLSGSNLSIGISLILRDQFTGRATAAGQSLDNLSRKAIAAQRRQLEMQRNINAAGAGIGIMAIRGMTQWARVGAEFGYTMNYVKTIAEEKGGVGFDMLSKRAKTLGADTMFTARQVADAMKYMAMAGQDTEAVYNNINAAVTLAGATMSRLEGKGGTADIMTNVMKGFGIDATMENSMKVADVLTTATTSANTNLSDLADAMKYSVSTAKDLNTTLEESAAMIMMAGDAGIQGSMAGTAVENMLRYITRAADETRKGRSGDALKSLGLSPRQLQDSKGNLLAMSPLLAAISRQVQNMGTAQRQNILTDLFGVRGKREASILLRNMGDFDKFIDKLNTKSSGRASANLESQMETLMGKGWQLTSAWESFKISFTEAIEPLAIPLLKLLTGATKILTAMVETPVGKFLTMLGAGFITVRTGILAYRAVVFSLRLAHLQMGTSFTSSASQVVSGYNNMTAAANRYKASSGSWFGGVMMGQNTGRFGKWAARNGMGTHVSLNSKGRQINSTTGKFIKTNSAPMGWSIGAGTTLGKWGSAIGKASPWAMLAGMGLSMGGNAVGGDLGKYMGMGGNAIGWAGTGAMLGSVVPGIGTAAGAIVGGVGSLLYDLYNELNETEESIRKAKAESKNKPFDPEDWKNKYRTLKSMYEGDIIYGRRMGDPNGQYAATNRWGANQYLAQGMDNKSPTSITINIDGKKAMEETVRESNYRTLIELAGF
ncbi:MAG: phage tail tape measure protein [Alteromonas sp.]|nr:phage tail tape measure protein [Alteromonas sp.]|tara:strand:+ start:13360 stop:15510 length:2151 start_codon:yes stop_codon:yes gene_type:complete